MRFRSTFVLLGIFVVLGGYVYFTEYRGQEDRAKQEAAKKKLFSTPPKDVTELSLVFPDRRISAVKKDAHWEITEPKGIDADSEEWDMLASSLGQIEKGGTVVKEKSDLAPYGLDKPTVEVQAKLKDGHSIGVLFGSENPKKTDSYAKLADSPEVFLSPSNWSKTYQKSLTDMRNKKVLEFVLDDIDSVRIEDGKNQIEIQKSGADWLFKKPVELKDTKADVAEVSGFLGMLQSAHATSFADEDVKPASTGLTPPEAKITLHDGKANSDRILSIGKSPEAGKYYAKDESRPAVLIVDKEIPGKVRRPLMEWRDKTIAHLDPESVDEIEIVRSAEKISLKKQGADWNLPDGRKAQPDKVSNLLGALEFERAVQLLAAPPNPSTYGLDKPRIEVHFLHTGKETLGLKFGAATKNPEGSYLKVSTNSAVMTVTADFYQKFSLKADDLAETKPAGK